MILGLVVLIVLAAGVAGAVVLGRSRPRHPGAARASAAGQARRVVVFALLFALVVVATTGVAGVLDHLLRGGSAPGLAATEDLAQSLAFVVVGVPLAAFLWWLVWRTLDAPEERASAAWSLYTAGLASLALVISSASLLAVLAGAVAGESDWPALATPVAWGAVWAWQRWAIGHPTKGPVIGTDLAPVVGTAYGLLIAVVGGLAALTALLGEFTGWLAGSTVGWTWADTTSGAVWAAGGLAVWALHWIRFRARELRTTLADAQVVGLGVVAAAALTVIGAIAVGFTVARLLGERGESLATLLEPAPFGIAAACVGGLTLAYHVREVRSRSVSARLGARLAVAAVGLAALATGLGLLVAFVLNLVVNATGPAGTALLTADNRVGLYLGASAMVVGAPTWWLAWGPVRRRSHDPERGVGLRTYAVVVLGVSALVALVTLLVIGYWVFDLLLRGASARELLDNTSGALGLLVAAGCVAAYHAQVWRAGRVAAPAVPVPQIGLVVLVTPLADPGPLAEGIRARTGARVTLWRSVAAWPSGALPSAAPTPVAALVPAGPAALDRAEAATAASPPAAALLDEAADALTGIAAPRVLVLAEPGAPVHVVPLAD